MSESQITEAAKEIAGYLFPQSGEERNKALYLLRCANPALHKLIKASLWTLDMNPSTTESDE